MKPRNILGFLFILSMAGLVYWRIEREPKPIIRTAHPPIQNTVEGQLAELPVSFPLSLTDSSGRMVSIPAPPQRIVSLAPSCTELLYDLGLDSRISADTTADDFPPEAAKKPHIGGYSDMSVERIIAQNPDLIVADNAINKQIIAQLSIAHVPVLVLEAHTILEVYDTIRILGRATGQNAEADRVVSGMKTRFDAIRKTVGRAISRPRVLVMYGTDPIYTSGPGSFQDDLISVAGGRNIVDRPAAQISSEAVVLGQPDVILCDDSIKDKVAQMPGWKERVPAVMNSTFFTPSSDSTLVRAVPRLTKAAEELAHFLHPELFTAEGKPAPLYTAPQKP